MRWKVASAVAVGAVVFSTPSVAQQLCYGDPADCSATSLQVQIAIVVAPFVTIVTPDSQTLTFASTGNPGASFNSWPRDVNPVNQFTSFVLTNTSQIDAVQISFLRAQVGATWYARADCVLVTVADPAPTGCGAATTSNYAIFDISGGPSSIIGGAGNFTWNNTNTDFNILGTFPANAGYAPGGSPHTIFVHAARPPSPPEQVRIDGTTAGRAHSDLRFPLVLSAQIIPSL